MIHSATISRTNFSFKWLVIPLLLLTALAIGVGLLYSEKWTILIFTVVFAAVAMFIEPFIGALFYLICLYARPMEILEATRGMPIMKFLGLGTLAIWLLHKLISRDKEFVKAPQNILTIAFLLVLIVSQRTNIHGILDIITGDFSKIIIIYFLLVNLVTTEKRISATIWILILSTLWLSIQGMLLSRGIVIGDIKMIEGGRISSSGIFGDPNDLAQAIVVAIPFVFNLFFYERFALKKIVLVIIGAVMIYSFLLTGSRGGFIGFAVAMFLLLRKKVGSIIGLLVLVITLVGLLTVAPSYTVERLETASTSEGTGGHRIELWYQGWLMFISNPIFGVGKGNFANLSEGGYVAHNSFVHVAAELGLPGLFIFIGLFYFSFKELNEARKVYIDKIETTRINVLSNSLMISIIGFISTAFFLSRQYQYLPYILVSLSIAMYQSVYKEKNLKLAFSFIELRNVLLVTFLFLLVWLGIIKVFL